MIVHTVFFWLKDGLSADDRSLFEKELRSLTAISSVAGGYCGVPASTDRPVIDRSYSYGLTVLFKDMAGHDAYQVDPIHKKFLADCGSMWTKVLVYDFQ